MKTAISIPDEVFDAAEQLVKRLGISRSKLYSKAISSFVQKHCNEGVTGALNKVYEKENSTIDQVIKTMQSSSLPKEKW